MLGYAIKLSNSTIISKKYVLSYSSRFFSSRKLLLFFTHVKRAPLYYAFSGLHIQEEVASGAPFQD